VQITGLNTGWRKPRYVFGIDSLHALHLAIQCAGAVLQSATVKLEWLGQTEELGIPKFLPWLPKAEQERLEAIVEREVAKSMRRAVRRRHANVRT
jgi:hypothetical protein